MYRWREEHEKEQKPKIAHEEIIGRGVKDSDKGGDGGEDKLGSEDTIDLADEAPPCLKPGIASP